MEIAFANRSHKCVDRILDRNRYLLEHPAVRVENPEGYLQHRRRWINAPARLKLAGDLPQVRIDITGIHIPHHHLGHLVTLQQVQLAGKAAAVLNRDRPLHLLVVKICIDICP